MSPADVEALLAARAEGGVLTLSRHRELPRLWHELGYRHGAEIGVEQGRYSVELLRLMPETHLLLVDAWRAYPGYRDHVSQSKLDAFHAHTLALVAPYADRVTVLRDWSTAAAVTVPDRSLDFVFIDANHEYDHVLADLAAWAPKVRAGGIVAGHDYGRRSVGQVAEAVQAWTAAHGIAPWWVTRGDRSPSWLWVSHG